MYDELVKRLHDYSAARKGEIAEMTAAAAEAIEELGKQVELEHKSGFADGQIAANRKRPRWVPVTERFPSENSRYLTVLIEPWFGTTCVDIMRWCGVWMDDARKTDAIVTHWMSLPEPPNGGQDDGQT